MMKQESLQAGFHGFTELVILKVLQAHKDQEKDVVRAAEACAATMAGVLPAEMVVRVLNPIVKTGDFPVNQAAIKMLTKLVERQTAESIEVHLAELMPGLLKVTLIFIYTCRIFHFSVDVGGKESRKISPYL